MTAAELLSHLNELGVSVNTADGKLKIKSPGGALTPDLRQQLRDHKDALLELLAPPPPPPSPSKESKPFKVFTDTPDGRPIIIETEEEWDALVRHFYQLRLMERRQSREQLKKNGR